MVLPSHPNHLDDVLVTQRVWGARDDIFFIGTSEMMLAPEGASLLTRVKTGLQGFLLQSAGFVPAHRAKDGRGGKSFQMANRATAEEFGKLIADGHIGVIFPGGGEELPPHRKAEKQGSMAGRIALAAEEAAGVAGKITYQIARIFPSNTRYPWKSTVTVRLSEPFTSETFVEAGASEPAIRRSFTELIDQRLSEEIDRIPREDDDLVTRISAFYRVEEHDDIERSGVVGKVVRQLSPAHSETRAQLERDLERHEEMALQMRVTPGDERGAKLNWVLTLLSALVCYPALLLHLAPLRLASHIARSRVEKQYETTYKLIIWGTFCMVGWYAAVAILLVTLALFGVVGWKVAGLVLCGMAAIGILGNFWFRQTHLSVLLMTSKVVEVFGVRTKFSRFMQLSDSLFAQLEELRGSLATVNVNENRVSSI